MSDSVRLVLFPDGTTVAAAPLAARQEDDPLRDYGLYCDPQWEPTWDANLIDWPDFGVPTDSEDAAGLIVSAFSRAKEGEHIEIGCIGALGRTGTVLACMAVLAGVPAESAVDWVRANYDSRAVETTEQADWVLWFGTWFRGRD